MWKGVGYTATEIAEPSFRVLFERSISHRQKLPTKIPGFSLAVMDLDTIPTFLAEQRDAAPPELQHQFLSFEDFWERRLWHQLTEILVEFFNHPDSSPQRIPVYKTFVLSFAEKINQLQLVTIGLSAATQCRGKGPARAGFPRGE